VVVLVDLHSKTITAWCFGTMEFDDFPNSWDDDLWLSYFFRGVVTTNQIIQKKLVLVLWLTIALLFKARYLRLAMEVEFCVIQHVDS